MSEHREIKPAIIGVGMPDGHYRFAYEEIVKKMITLESRLTELQVTFESCNRARRGAEAQLEEVREWLKYIQTKGTFGPSDFNVVDKLLTPKEG